MRSKQKPAEKAWVRQLLLIRYHQLLTNLKSQFPVSQEQEAALMKKILTIDWLESAFEDRREAQTK